MTPIRITLALHFAATAAPILLRPVLRVAMKYTPSAAEWRDLRPAIVLTVAIVAPEDTADDEIERRMWAETERMVNQRYKRAHEC